MDTDSPDGIDRRAATRHDLSLDVTIDGLDRGVTENVSSSGVLLVGNLDVAPGEKITMDMDIPALLGGGGGRVRFQAEVVRVEERAEGRAVAARFTDWRVIGA